MKTIATYLEDKEFKIIEKASSMDNRSLSNFLKISAINRAKKMLEIAEIDFENIMLDEEKEIQIEEKTDSDSDSDSELEEETTEEEEE